MSELSWPVVTTGDPPVYPDGGVDLNIARHRVMFADRTGVVGYPASSDRTVYADGSGLQVKRRAGARWIQGIYGTDDAEKTMSVNAPHSSLWRIDRVVDRLTADGVIKTFVKPGTADASPVAPPLTQVAGGTWEESLGSFHVAPNAVTVTSVDAAVTDERRFIPLSVTPVSSDAQRQANPRIGDEVDFPDGRRQRWTGSTWATVYSPGETWTPSVRSNSNTWALSAATGSRGRDHGWVDGWSLATLGNNGPSFQAASAPALPVYVALPYAAPAGYRGPVGTWGYTTDTGSSVAAGELIVGYDAYEGAARLTFAGGVLFTSNQWSLMCLWHYPAA